MQAREDAYAAAEATKGKAEAQARIIIESLANKRLPPELLADILDQTVVSQPSLVSVDKTFDLAMYAESVLYPC